MTVVCESHFYHADPKNPDYSSTEMDVYGHLPHDKALNFPDHRLTIRKNLKTGNYEVYRAFSKWAISTASLPDVVVDSEGNKTQVIHTTPKLASALRVCNAEDMRFWDLEAFSPQPCDHNLHRAAFCDWQPPIMPQRKSCARNEGSNCLHYGMLCSQVPKTWDECVRQDGGRRQ